MNRRIDWIDICKGIAIILVVFGHTMVQDLRANSKIAMFIYNCIYFFHNRFFFVLSGFAFLYFYKSNYSFGQFISKRINRLMIPYILYSVFVFLIFKLFEILGFSYLSNSISLNLTIKQLFISLLIGHNYWAVHLWYLYELFILSIIMFLVVKRNNNFFLEVSTVFFFITYLFTYYNPVPIYILNLVLNYGVYFCVGCLFAKYYKALFLQENGDYRIAIFSIISWLYLFLRAFCISKGFKIQFLVNNALLTLVFSIGIMMSIIKLTNTRKTENFKVLQFLGKKSMVIYLFHQPFIVSGGCQLIYKLFPSVILFGILLLPIIGIIVPIIIDYLWNAFRIKRGKCKP